MRPVNEDRLQKTLSFIQRVERETGYSPTYREIQEVVGQSSLRSVYQDVQRLRDRGLIRSEQTARGGMMPDERLAAGEMVNVQVVGEIHCGEANEAIENITESYLLPVDLIGRGEHIMLRAQGYSMTRRGIFPGDLLVIRPVVNYTPRAHDVVAVSIGREEACAKVIERGEDGEYWFCADSDETDDYGNDFPDYPLDAGTVFGVVDCVIHYPRG